MRVTYTSTTNMPKPRIKLKLKKGAKEMPTQTKNTAVKNKYKFNSTSMEAKTIPLVEGSNAIPRVYYTNKVYNEIRYLVQKCVDEVCWFGSVEKKGADYLVTEIFVPKQKVSAASAEIDAEDLSDIALELEDPSTLYYWGHSHVNMQVRPSATDEEQFAEYLNDCDVMIRGIYNKKGDSKVDVADTVNGVLHQSVQNGMLTEALTKESKNRLDELIKKNVSKQVYQTRYNGSNLSAYSGGVHNFGGHHMHNKPSSHSNIFVVKTL